MREIRPSGSEGGVAYNGHPYPYNTGVGCRGSKLHGGRSPQRQAQRNAAGCQRSYGEY